MEMGIEHIVETVERAMRYASASGSEYMNLYWSVLLEDFKRIQNGEPYVLASYYIPRSIIAIFDIPVLYMERTAGWGCVCNVAKQRETGCESVCSYQKILHGMLCEKVLPYPRYIIVADVSCDDALHYGRYLSKERGIPIMELTFKGAPHFTALQLSNLFQKLESDFEIKREMREIVRNVSESMMWKRKIEELCDSSGKTIPGQICMNLFPIYNDLGLAKVTECLRCLYKECNRLPSIGMGEGKHRLLWLGTAPVRTPLLQKIEKCFDCVFVYTELFYFPFVNIEEKNFFEALAEMIHRSYYCYPINRIARVMSIIEKYNVEGVIHFSQARCRVLPSMVPSIKGNSEERGIPVLEIEGDGVEISPDIDKYMKMVGDFIDAL